MSDARSDVTRTSIMKSYTSTSREKMKAMVNKVRFSESLDRSLPAILAAAEDEGDLRTYTRFIASLQDDTMDDAELLRVIREAKENVNLLRPHFRGLVECLLNTDWLRRGDGVIEEFQVFIIELLVAHNKYTISVVERLVDAMVPPEEAGEQWPRGEPVAEERRRLQYVHDTLNRLMDVVPMVYNVLMKQLDKLFPFYRRPAHVIGGFVHNLLWILAYRPMAREQILTLIMVKLLELDVNTLRPDIEEAEEESDEESDVPMEAVFDMEDVKPPSEQRDEDEMRLPLAESLDVGLCKVFDFVVAEVKANQGSDTYLQMLYEIFLGIFHRHILPTHSSHHSQFVVFFMCHFKAAFADHFLQTLWRKAVNFNLAAPLREAAVSYIASFLARAKFVPLATIQATLRDLCAWAHQYIERSDGAAHASLRSHSVFYSVCQAIFYVIAFRSRDLTAAKEHLLFLQSLQLSALVTCQLNPLRVCIGPVATTFAGVTRAHQLAYCHTVLERNARRRLATVYAGNAQLPEECLDSSFPFDPFLLKKAGRHLEPLYLHYHAEEDANADEADSGTGSDEKRGRKRHESVGNEDVDDFISADKRQRIRDAAASFERDLLGYGVSPGFQQR